MIERKDVLGGLWTEVDEATHAVKMQRSDGSWAWFAASASEAAVYARMRGDDMSDVIVEPMPNRPRYVYDSDPIDFDWTTGQIIPVNVSSFYVQDTETGECLIGLIPWFCTIAGEEYARDHKGMWGGEWYEYWLNLSCGIK